MHNDFDVQGGSTDGDSYRSRKTSDAQPMADREVPIGGKRNIDLINAWLDGDLPEAAVRRGDMAKDVELWRQITAETDRRRHLRTPAHVQARIMEALPQSVPQVISPWYAREFVVSPIVAVAAVTGLVAVTAAVTALVLRAL
ncbi:MAG: hypothetical protein ACRENI_09640 [Gemmatimonadaceae bacterium]